MSQYARGQKGGQKPRYELSPFNLTEAMLIANAEACPFATDTETATHWRARGWARAVIENAAALPAAADAPRMMVESELGA